MNLHDFCQHDQGTDFSMKRMVFGASFKMERSLDLNFMVLEDSNPEINSLDFFKVEAYVFFYPN